MDGKYCIPNDESEVERLDLQHHMFLLTIDGVLHLAPLQENIHNVLDVGCGTGAWSIAFADDHPSARVQGVDLSPIQPEEVPPNCTFIIDDAEADWIHHEKFDFIYSRAMVICFRDWPKFFNQAFEHLKPGGYLELHDFCFPLASTRGHNPETSKFLKWSEYMENASKRSGLNLRAPLKWQEQLKEAGFVDIEFHYTAWPMGPWAKGRKQKTIGKMCLQDAKKSIHAAGLALFTRVLGWSAEDTNAFFSEAEHELDEQKIHFYASLVFCYARKPENTRVD